MAKITITVEGSTVGTVTVTDTLDQFNSDRFMSWLVHSYGTDAEGLSRAPADIIATCWSAIRAGIFNNIVSYEAEQAAADARAAILPMASETAVDQN